MKKFEVFFDGQCPLCSREIQLLKKLDKQDKIIFTDISTPSFDANAFGLKQSDFMAEIRGRLQDGKMIAGVEVFRQLYEAVGMKCLVRISRFPIIAQMLDLGYRIFAKNRLRLTGRCDLNKECK